VDLVDYDELGEAELHFADPFDIQSDHYSHTHSIRVDPRFIERYKP
jgi:hypothetical protein